MAQQRGGLGSRPTLGVLGVVWFVSFEQQQLVGPVRGQTLFGEEERVACGHHALDRQEAGVSMVRVQAVALPWVMAEHDGGPQLPG